MDVANAANLGTATGFLVIGLLGLWYVKPYLQGIPRSTALSLLIAPHAFRYIALQLFGAQAGGLAISDSARNFIAYGDLISALLALIALGAIKKRAPWAPAAIWTFAVFGLVDLIAAVARSLDENLSETADSVMFLVSTVYVPLLFVSLFLLIWQLATHTNDDLPSHDATPTLQL